MGSAAAAPVPSLWAGEARGQGRQGGRMTQPVTGSVQLRVDDVTLDLPRLPATAGNDGVVVSALLKETGLVTVDPGFMNLSLIHISEPTRLGMISYAVFCLKKKTTNKKTTNKN